MTRSVFLFIYLPSVTSVSFDKNKVRYKVRYYKVPKNGNESVDNGGAFGALMTELSKSFDCLHHELLIAKLDACVFHIKSLKLIQQYLSNRKQRVKISNAYSSWK